MYYSATTADRLPDVLDPDLIARHLRLGPGEESSEYLELLAKAAMRWAEGETNQPLFLRAYRVVLTGFTGGTIRGKALGESIQVNYCTTAESDPVALAPAGYYVLDNEVSFVRSGLPNLTPYRVELTYSVGYDQDTLPDDIKLALLGHIGFSYENRSNPVAERYTLADKLLNDYKLYNC